jgi:hypothetical protein
MRNTQENFVNSPPPPTPPSLLNKKDHSTDNPFYGELRNKKWMVALEQQAIAPILFLANPYHLSFQ